MTLAHYFEAKRSRLVCVVLSAVELLGVIQYSNTNEINIVCDGKSATFIRLDYRLYKHGNEETPSSEITVFAYAMRAEARVSGDGILVVIRQ
jgi:hypothetical protein